MIACVLIDELAVLAHPDAPKHVPLLFLDDTRKRAGVAAMSARSRTFGITRGMSRTRAQALCPNAAVLSLERARVDALLQRILTTLWTYTNRIEVDEAAFPQSGILFLDLGRTTDADAVLLGQQMRAALGRFDVPCAVALAHGKFVAHAVALSLNCGDICVVPRGTEAARLAPLPLDTLPLTKDAKRTLTLMNIHTIGDVAALPRTAVVERFGRQGQLWHQFAGGADYRAIRPQRMPETERVGRDFDAPVKDVQSLQRVLDVFANTLAIRLESRASIAHEFTLTVYFDGGAVRREKRIRADGLADCGAIRTQLYQLFEEMQPDRPMAGVAASAGQLHAHLPRQLDLFSYRPAKQAMIDFVQILLKRHGTIFFTVRRDDTTSLLSEERFQFQQVDVQDVS